MNFKQSLITTLLVVAAGSVYAKESKNFSQTYDFNSNGTVDVENINGDISVEGWDKNEIALEYVITADNKEDLDKVEVKIKHSKSNFDVEVDYQSSRSFFGSGDGGSGEVDFVLKVPHAVRLDAVESVNGNLDIRNVTGDIDADAVNGTILVENAVGNVEVESVNGNVEVSMSDFSQGQKISSDSVNGNIRITLPENAGFELSSDTINGDLSNDFDIHVHEGKFVGAEMKGSYKEGNAKISADTVNGDVKVRKK